VLVFDGATPEIKLRELQQRRRQRLKRKRGDFVDGDGDGNNDNEDLHRIAKRLLSKQLIKGADGKLTFKNIAMKQETEGNNHEQQQEQQSADAPGFYDPEEEERQKLKHQETQKQETQKEESIEELLKDDHYLENDDDDEKIVIVNTKNGNDKQQGPDNKEEEEVNDWDIQIIDGTNEEATKQKQKQEDVDNPTANNNLDDTDNDEEDEDNVEYEEYNPFVRKSERRQQKLQRQNRNRNRNPDKLDVDYVATLNSDERTSVIEDLRRKHYVESRREYLKVAYDPERFGSAQITNFLKSTRLNKDISTMAQKATKLQEEQLLQKRKNMDSISGRIIFEKDTDIQQQEGPSSEQQTKKKRSTRKQKLSNLLFYGQHQSAPSRRKDDNDDDDDENIDWQDSGIDKHNPSGDNYFSGRKKSGVSDDDDVFSEEEEEYDNDDDDDDKKKTKHEETAVALQPKTYLSTASGDCGFLVPALENDLKQTTSSASKDRRRRTVIHLDDDDDDDDEGKGNDLDTKLPAKSDAMIAQELQDEALARALQEADDDDDRAGMAGNQGNDDSYGGGGGGGFLPDNGGGFLPRSDDRHPDDDDTGAAVVEKVVLTVHDSDSDEEMKQMDQERTDEAVARTLQEVEYEYEANGGGGFFVSDRKLMNKYTLDDVGGGGFLPEDPPNTMESSLLSNLSNDKAEVGSENLSQTANINKSKTTTGGPSSQDSDDDEDDGDVDWEDGDEPEEEQHTLAAEPRADKMDTFIAASQEMKANEHNKEMKQKPTSTAGMALESMLQPIQKESSDADMNDSQSIDELDEQSVDEEIEVGSGAADFLLDDDWKAGSSSKTTEEMAAALERAQETAANLTNWAGRAFRQAVAQHAVEQGMEVPKSAKPKVLKNDPVDKETISTVLDAPEQLINETTKPTIASRVQKETQASSQNAKNNAVDNSEWVNTMVDTETLATNYNIAASGSNSDPSASMDGGLTDEMRGEVMQLLRLFGVPYVVAPAEAEAQCCMLEELGLVDGIVTEDSDAFVFGGQVVYKNIFDDQKYVEVYHAKDAVAEMNLTRDSMVALAMLLGGDYTEGVKGVGIVNGMEVVQAFDVADGVKSGLTRFRKWLDGFDPASGMNAPDDASSSELSNEQKFHRKHRSARARWIPPKYFPDEKVLNAYLNPVVDTSEERFSWGMPDLDALISFCHGRIGWPPEETKRLVLPVVERLHQGSMRQTRIDSFMRYEDGIKFASIRSKRLREVLEASSNKASKGGKT
jgi:DNA excision repair protein ERCC-5